MMLDERIAKRLYEDHRMRNLLPLSNYISQSWEELPESVRSTWMVYGGVAADEFRSMYLFAGRPSLEFRGYLPDGRKIALEHVFASDNPFAAWMDTKFFGQAIIEFAIREMRDECSRIAETQAAGASTGACDTEQALPRARFRREGEGDRVEPDGQCAGRRADPPEEA